MIEFHELLGALIGNEVDFIVVGGAAATAHGSARLTKDLDIVYRRSDANIGQLVSALAPLEPYLRGAPLGLPFRWDVQTVQKGLNFTLITRLGALDLLGEIAGGGRYEDLQPQSVVLNLYGFDCQCLSLDQLITTKRAAGRPKDFEAIAELEALREEQER